MFAFSFYYAGLPSTNRPDVADEKSSGLLYQVLSVFERWSLSCILKVVENGHIFSF